MQVKGIVWAGTWTDRYLEMNAFCRDVLGLNQTRNAGGISFFDLPNGDRLEVFAAESKPDGSGARVVVGFLVDDVAEAREVLESKGVEFIGPVHRNPEGYAWTHFRAPDGSTYSLTCLPEHRDL